MAKHQYHYGRISTITNTKTGAKSYRMGPVQDANGLSYRGARGASVDHVIRLVKKIKGNDITISAQGRMYAGDPKFTWIGEVWDKNSLLSRLEDLKKKGWTMERIANDIFGMRSNPDLILSWEVREHR